jgi:hypothetical protein
MTAEERMSIQEAARRYVREQAPIPPIAVLERIARIIQQARTSGPPEPASDRPTGGFDRSEAA